MGSQGSVLLVDDDVFTSRMMELHLQKDGLAVVTAGNGHEALAKLDERRFDLVLTDLVMPEMSGLELVRAIRARPDCAEIPLLILSGLDNTGMIVEAMKAGATDFIPKMKEHQLVLAKVRHELALHDRGAQTPRASGDALWSWSFARGEVQYSNRWKAMLGYAPEEIGKSPEEWLDRLHPDDREGVLTALEAHQARKTGWFEADFRIHGKDGSWKGAHAFGVAMFGKDGACVRMVGSMCLLADAAFRERIRNALENAISSEDLDTVRQQIAAVSRMLS